MKTFRILFFFALIFSQVPLNAQNTTTADAGDWLAVARKPRLYGLEDTSGREILPAVYEELFPQAEGLWIASLNDRYGIINEKGEWMVKAEYYRIVQYMNGRFVAGRKVKEEKKKQKYTYYGSADDSVIRFGIVDKSSGSWVIEARYAFISMCEDGNIIFKDENDQYGFLDKDGKEIIKPQYEFASAFHEGVCVVSTGGESVGSQYNVYRRNAYLEGTRAYDYDQRNKYSSGKWKLINKKGEPVTTVNYDYIRDMHDGRSAFNTGGIWKKRYSYGRPHLVSGQWGFLDNTGKEVIEAKYDYVYDFKDGVAKVRQGDRVFYIDKTGSEVPRPLQSDSLAQNQTMIFCQPGHYGFINAKGQWAIQPQYQNAYSFSEGLAGVKIAKGDDLECNDEPDYGEYFEEQDEVSLLRLRRRNRRTTVTYDEVMRSREELAYRSSYGYVDNKGTMVIEGKFQDVMPFSEGLAYVRIKGSWGIIDKSGKWIMQPILESPFGGDYDYEEDYSYLNYQPSYNRNYYKTWQTNWNFYYHFSEGMGVIRKYEKYGFVDKDGKIVVAPIYDDVRPFSNGMAAVQKDQRWGFIDKTGKIVIPIRYHDAFDFSEGLARVSEPLKRSDEAGIDSLFTDDEDKRWGYIDLKGKFVIASQFTSASDFEGGLAAAVMNYAHAGYIDHTGKFAIAPRYTSADDFLNGYAQVEVPGASVVFIDKTGKVMKQYNDKNPPPVGPQPLKLYQTDDKKFGFKNDKGDWVIMPIYNDAAVFTKSK